MSSKENVSHDTSDMDLMQTFFNDNGIKNEQSTDKLLLESKI